MPIDPHPEPSAAHAAIAAGDSTALAPGLQELQDEWDARTAKALALIDRGIDLTQPLNMEPDEYRARLAAAKLVLGAQRSALPLPTRRGLRVVGATVTKRTVRLQWADGRPVAPPQLGAGQAAHDQADREEEEEEA